MTSDALAAACGACGSPRGMPCTDAITGQPAARPHYLRVQHAAQPPTVHTTTLRVATNGSTTPSCSCGWEGQAATYARADARATIHRDNAPADARRKADTWR